MELLALLYIPIAALIGLMVLSILNMLNIYHLTGAVYWAYAIGYYALWVYIIKSRSYYPKSLIRFAIEWSINIIYMIFTFGHSFNVFYGNSCNTKRFFSKSITPSFFNFDISKLIADLSIFK